MQLLENATTIKMSRVSFELLMNFIQRNQIWSMLSICNEYLSFDIQPKVQSTLRPLDALLMKDTGDEGLQVNQKDLNLGLLKGCLEDTLVAQAVNELQQVCSYTLQVQDIICTILDRRVKLMSASQSIVGGLVQIWLSESRTTSRMTSLSPVVSC
jgi:hypothetical protein